LSGTSAPYPLDRAAIVRRGKRLEYFTIFYNSLEALAAMIAGIVSGSIALVGFGVDSVIEVTSGAALLWRLDADVDPARWRQAERLSLRAVGVSFLLLSVYLVYESAGLLIRRAAPERSIPGILLAAVSVFVMPLLARAKRRVAAGIESAAMRADARQTDFCTCLSAILLTGLGLNALLGWWWADPVAALAMTPIIAHEGIRAVRGENCGCAATCH
jgi:divalent metal cation (Fe/Co/Zn/Cd) transporter